MKKHSFSNYDKSHFVFFIFYLMLVSESCQNIENKWQTTKDTNTKEAFEKFVKENQSSAYIDSAYIRLFDLYKLDARNENTIEAYNELTERFKSTSIADSTKSFAINMAFQLILKDTTLESHKSFVNYFFPSDNASLKTSGSADLNSLKRLYAIKAYESVIKQYPNSPFIDEAKSKFIALKWEEVLSENTVEAFEKFISNYPENDYKGKAEEGLYAVKTRYNGTINSCELASMMGDGVSNEFTGMLTTTFSFKLKEFPKITFFMSDWTDGYRLLSIRSNEGINLSEKCRGIKIELVTKKSKSLNKVVSKYTKL